MEYIEKIKWKDRTFLIRGETDERVIYDCLFDDGSPTKMNGWMSRQGFDQRIRGKK